MEIGFTLKSWKISFFLRKNSDEVDNDFEINLRNFYFPFMSILLIWLFLFSLKRIEPAMSVGALLFLILTLIFIRDYTRQEKKDIIGLLFIAWVLFLINIGIGYFFLIGSFTVSLQPVKKRFFWLSIFASIFIFIVPDFYPQDAYLYIFFILGVLSHFFILEDESVSYRFFKWYFNPY